MREVFIKGINILSPLGMDASENYEAIIRGKSSVKPYSNNQPGYNSVFTETQRLFLEGLNSRALSFFENLLLQSILRTSTSHEIFSSDDTLYVFATTKGNIRQIDSCMNGKVDPAEFSLNASAKRVLSALSSNADPVVISNACTSGVVSLLYARRLLASGKFKHAVVAGADTYSEFVHSGFHSLHAITETGCKPFSKNRDGIALGEASAAIVLSIEPPDGEIHPIRISAGRITNDANHISAPSRTGEELAQAIQLTALDAGLTIPETAFISAHGTATVYNDEMEAKAFQCAGMSKVPVNSLKGAFGHTLGAAGLLESIIGIMAFKKKANPPTIGYDGYPLSDDLNVSIGSQVAGTMNGFIKTASGFGGCNAAVVFMNRPSLQTPLQ